MSPHLVKSFFALLHGRYGYVSVPFGVDGPICVRHLLYIVGNMTDTPDTPQKAKVQRAGRGWFPGKAEHTLIKQEQKREREKRGRYGRRHLNPLPREGGDKEGGESRENIATLGVEATDQHDGNTETRTNSPPETTPTPALPPASTVQSKSVQKRIARQKAPREKPVEATPIAPMSKEDAQTLVKEMTEQGFIRQRSERGNGEGEGFGGEERRKRSHARVTEQEMHLSRELATSKSVWAAGKAAGYSDSTMKNPSWYRKVHEKIRPLTLAHFARAGLTLPRVAQRLSDLLDAEKGMSAGQGVISMVPDNDARLKTADTYLRVLGPLGKLATDMPGDEELGGSKVSININIPGVMGHATGEKEIITLEIEDTDEKP